MASASSSASSHSPSPPTASCFFKGTWCSGITSAPHAEGPGLKSQCVQINAEVGLVMHVSQEVSVPHGRHGMSIAAANALAMPARHASATALNMQVSTIHSRAHAVVASHPLRMRKALGSNPSGPDQC